MTCNCEMCTAPAIQCTECGSVLGEVRVQNAHSEHNDVFCSEECARLDRVRFVRNGPSMFVLFGREQDSDVSISHGVYANDEQLKRGVDYWMDLRPKEILSYEEWQVGYPNEPLSWEWCYIPLGSSSEKLASGGGSVPKHFFWGKNLVGITWETDDDEEP